jgi:hypothetical protein
MGVNGQKHECMSHLPGMKYEEAPNVQNGQVSKLMTDYLLSFPLPSQLPFLQKLRSCAVLPAPKDQHRGRLA